MGDFIKQVTFSRVFYPHQDFGILKVGYDDFSVVKPAAMFRTQKFYTWHFVLSGRGTLEIYDKKYTIKSGEMFFIPPNTTMRYYPDKQDPWEYVWFACKGELMEQYSELVGFSPESPVCVGRNFEKMKRALKRLFNLLIDGEGGCFSALSVFFEIMDICTTRSSLTKIQQVKRLLDEDFTSPNFSVEQICHDVGISHAHLLRLFKEAYGVTIIKYISKKRLDLACELLRITDLSVRSIAFSCGFSDEIHFMKTFKKTTGLSALQYRRETINKMP